MAVSVPAASIRVKRVYEPPAADDGTRILVDRLWPRGLSREAAHIDRWMKEIAPSTALRTWYAHAPERWPEFRDRYRNELATPEGAAMLSELRAVARDGTVTLLFGTRETERNNAVALRAILLGRR